MSETSERFRENLLALISHLWPDASQAQAAARMGVQQRTLGRYLNGESVPTLDMAEELLRKCGGFEPWQLLAPGFDPRFPPRLVTDASFSRKSAAEDAASFSSWNSGKRFHSRIWAPWRAG